MMLRTCDTETSLKRNYVHSVLKELWLWVLTSRRGDDDCLKLKRNTELVIAKRRKVSQKWLVPGIKTA